MNRLPEMCGGAHGWDDLRRELGGGVRVGRRVGESRGGEFVEVEGGGGCGVPAVDAELGLADVGGGADEVDGEVVGGDEAGEVEELVEMALSW